MVTNCLTRPLLVGSSIGFTKSQLFHFHPVDPQKQPVTAFRFKSLVKLKVLVLEYKNCLERCILFLSGQSLKLLKAQKHYDFHDYFNKNVAFLPTAN